jgi:Lipoprotein LpqB beta-propeller domain/Sporulation and spore germination
MTQQQIVDGFLRASASFDDDHAVARMYLAPETASAWDPDAGTVVYADDTERRIVGSDGNVVRLVANKVAQITGRGQYAASAADSMVRASFTLRRVDGEWRIADLPDGLYLTPLDVDRSYRPYDLYFLDPTSTRLVPNTIFVPVGPFASTTLVTALLQGPTDWLAPAVRTAFPAGTALSLASAPVSDGVVQVDLNSAVLQADLDDREALSAQLVWTLRQLPDVSAVRITVGAVPLPGVNADQRRDAWPQYSPDGLDTGDAVLSRNQRLYRLTDEQLVPVPGRLGDGRVPAVDPAVSPEGDLIAALSPAHDKLYMSTAESDVAVRTRFTASALTPPSWDPFGAVWTTSPDGAGTAVWAVRPGDTEPRRVESPELADRRVVTLRMSRDGARAAVVVDAAGGRQLYLARVERSDDRIVLAGLRRVESVLIDVADVAWVDADRMAVLGREANGVMQPLILGVDGEVSRAAGSLSGLVRIGAGPGKPLLATTKDGGLWLDTDVGWQSVGKGSDPAYPG